MKKIVMKISYVFLLTMLGISVSAQTLKPETKLKLDAKHTAAIKIDYESELVTIISWYYKASEEIKKSERCSFLTLNNLARAAGSPDSKNALDCINTSLVYSERELYQGLNPSTIDVCDPHLANQLLINN